MFVATALVYPCVLAVLCSGAGLLVDRLSGFSVPAPLLLPIGAAALIAVSQVTTRISAAAPATPYTMLAVAAAGWWLGRGRAAALLRRRSAAAWPLGASIAAYAVALAPVLAAGRPTFSSFMALADSAVHMMGADYLLHHGQAYAHLDLRNSYGQFINDYYNSGYPSGADTLFGGSAFLLGLPLIWAFQPFCAFVLASCVGPAWLLARLVGLPRALAAAAALSVTLPALVYGYELIGSVKELVALPMILALGSLTALHRRWLLGSPRGALPFALVSAAGVSALGIGFGPWVLAPSLVLLAIAVGAVRAGAAPARRLLALAGAGAAIGVLAALPTWLELSSSLRVASTIASTGNPGNLRSPLHRAQVLGIWLHGSYKLAPAGTELALTDVLIGIAILLAVLGAAHLLARRSCALAAWLALMLLSWVLVDRYVTTWAGAKTLMLTSPLVVLLCWAGIAALTRLPRRRTAMLAAGAAAALLLGGALASDAIQYRASNLAPTARYRELASLNDRFAGRGPTVFTDFDEYALYELRSLDVGGPDFAYPPPALAAAAGGYGAPVDLGRVRPGSLAAYPLIVTRRDPSRARPPSAYRLLWSGSYYEVWGRTHAAPPAAVHLALSGTPRAQCTRIGRLARGVAGRSARLIGAEATQLVRVPLLSASHPAGWGRQRQGFAMKRPGRLAATFELPFGGRWNLWVQGQIMPSVKVRLDGRLLASVGGQLSGNSLVPDTAPPLAVVLSSGSHRLTVTRGGASLAPGEEGSAVLAAIFLTPASYDPQRALRAVAVSRWPALCGRAYSWVELLGG
ncbi:MAG TPA: hypothetical protein VHY83_12285 [Solirubrobacteraceae bacterium]|jgi:hypothetical protein|nr:hypothetical protein [Solirubrobacteraceae bacterium]